MAESNKTVNFELELATPGVPLNTLTAENNNNKEKIDQFAMHKGIYDTDGDGKVDKAQNADVAASVDWTGVENRPANLPNPGELTLQQNGTTSSTYDGALACTFDVTPDGIGAARLENGKVFHEQLPISDTTNSTSTVEVASANAVRMAKEEAVTESVAYTNAGLPEVANVKEALDALSDNSTKLLAQW